MPRPATATNRQLWALNVSGFLAMRDVPDKAAIITAAQAGALLDTGAVRTTAHDPRYPEREASTAQAPTDETHPPIIPEPRAD